MSTRKRLLFWAIMLALPVLVLLLVIEGYYLYGYLTLRADYCRSFARLDGEIGWTLAPDTESCIVGRSSAFGEVAYRATVHTNADGARVPAEGAPTPRGGVLAIGDSWTFGYGIDGDETFAAQLAARHDRPAALFASPAYSGAQALLLGRRVVDQVRPEAIVYLEFGFWDRAVCTGASRPTAIEKPCYWVDGAGDGEARLVTPPEGRVARMADLGILPGGMVGAGEKTLAYFLIARPLAKLHGLFVRLGLASGFGDDFAAVAPAAEKAAIKRAHYRNLVALAREARATLVLLDPYETYSAARAATADDSRVRYVGEARWRRAVARPMQDLPAAAARVPHDGHYGPGTHALIADLVDSVLAGAPGRTRQ